MGRTIQQHHGPALSCLCCELSSVRALSCPLSSRLHTCFSIPPKGSRAVDQQAQSCGETLSTIMLHLLSLSITFSQENHHPHAPVGFAQFTLLQNVFVLRSGCVPAQAHTHTHRVTGTLLASSAIIIQCCPCSVKTGKGIKAETGTVCDMRKGVTETRDPICSHSPISQCRS